MVVVTMEGEAISEIAVVKAISEIAVVKAISEEIAVVKATSEIEATTETVALNIAAKALGTTLLTDREVGRTAVHWHLR